MNFVEQAFQHHDTTSPNGPETSAFTARQWIRAKTRDNAPGLIPVSDQAEGSGQAIVHSHTQRRIGRLGALSPVENEFRSLLPDEMSASLLVDNYFSRIHWFMLVFHQSDFRQKFRQLYDVQGGDLAYLQPGLGFLSVFLAVCLVSLRYTGVDQKRTLTGYGVEPANLQERLLSTLRLRLLDIVSLGSIEAVQSCILLGSLYLYHGAPELAWPICGCGLRIAQALNLHRGGRSPVGRVLDLGDPTQQAEETRKRCWWAIYEIETFCSMLYGFPLSISDSDCDIELLNPYASRLQDPSWTSAEWQAAGQATLLSYKRSMAQLSIIVKSALTGLYGLHRKQPDGEHRGMENESRLQDLILEVANLDTKLHAWYQSLPKQLRLGEDVEFWPQQSPAVVPGQSPDILDRHLQLHIFQLQRLALKLAFENARILIHRPLLSYKTVDHSDSPDGPESSSRLPQTPDPFRFSIHACRDAAMQISQVGTMPIFKEAGDTYAVSFISLHLFTAGVTLSIMAGSRPLSRESYESKMGLRRLMGMQARLKSRSIVAEQGFGILKKLMLLIMSKETDSILEFESVPECQDEGPEQQISTTDKANLRAREGKFAVDTASNAPGSSSPRMSNGSPWIDRSTEAFVPQETAAIAQLDFCEDPLMSQALLEFEQVMNYFPNEETGESAAVFTDYLPESCFNSQDQGWIWGSNHRI